jgi:N-formylglutamate amidohydrolase
MVIGTRDGSTAGAEFTAVVVDHLRAAGYQVAINEGFKGVELVRRYSDPAAGRESLQIEVNRGLYMDEEAITRSARFAQTKADISDLIAAVAEYARRQVTTA